MNSNLEDKLTGLMQRRADQVAPSYSADIAEKAIGLNRRRQQQHRRWVMTASVVATAAAVAAVSMSPQVFTDRSSTRGPLAPAASTTSLAPTTQAAPTRNPTTPSPSSKPPPPQVKVTPCTKVIPPPPDVERDTVLDKANGLLRFAYSVPGSAAQRTYWIAYRDDPTCKQDSQIRQLIRHVLKAADW